MTQTAQGPGRATVARIIHLAILIGLGVAFAVFVFLQGQLAAAAPAESDRILRFAGYGLLIVSAAVSLVFRGRIPPRRAMDLEDWWTTALPRALVVWASAEGGSLGAMVLGWMIGDTTLLALAAATGLALLFVSRPGRLQSEI